ncbi:MAG: hypothetical protein JNM94_08320 [Phycisphaerae bacterium]|nr:hypothetical protein [Phycisphaerae bacterium]
MTAWTIATLVVAASCTPDGGNDKPTRAEIDQLISALDRALSGERRVEAILRQRIWQGPQNGPAPDIARDPPGSDQRSIVRLLGPRQLVLGELPLDNVTVVFDDFMYVYHPSEAESYVSPAAGFWRGPHLTMVLQTSTLPLFQTDGTSRASLEAIRTSTPISFERNGTEWTYRFYDKAEEAAVAEAEKRAAANGEPTPARKMTPWPREVIVDVGDPPRLVGVALDMPLDGPEKPLVRNETRVIEWQQVGTSTLPRRVLTSTSMAGAAPYRLLVEVENAAEIPPAADDATVHPLPAGLTFVNSPRTFRFTVGSPHIVYEGQRLTLEEPLWVHPGERLGELVKSAKPE